MEATGRLDTWVKEKPFLQLVFSEHLLCARHRSRHEGTEGNENKVCESGAHILARESGGEPQNIEKNNFNIKKISKTTKPRWGKTRWQVLLLRKRLEETFGQNDMRSEQSGYQVEEHSQQGK